MSWSGMRSRLEDEHLAASLHGHIQYYATSYSQCPGHEGRAAVRLDDKRIIADCYYDNWLRAVLFPRDARYGRRVKEEIASMDGIAVQLDVFDWQNFYRAFSMFDNQSIEKSLASENMLVRIFAILDHKVGKRKLEKIKQDIEGEEKTFRKFFVIRTTVEGVATKGEREG